MVLLACAFALPAGLARADTPPELPPEPSALIIEQQQEAAPEPSAPAAIPPEPVVEPQDPPPAVIADGGGAQPGAEAPEPEPQPAAEPAPQPGAEPTPQPARQQERAPQAEMGQAPAPGPATTPPAPEDVPNPIQAPAPPEAPDPQARVAPSQAPQTRDKAITDRGPRLVDEVDVRLRRVEHSIERVKSQLDAGKAPPGSSLRALRKNVEELAPAVVALERHMASHSSPELDTGGVGRRLRRALAGAAALVSALARSGVDTPESGRLVSVLERFAGAAATVWIPGRTGAGHATPAVLPQPAYTHPAAASGQSWSGLAGQDPSPAATASWPRRERPVAGGSRTLTQLGGRAAPTNFSLGLAALALLLALAVSASLSSFLLSGWGFETTATAPVPRRGSVRRTRTRRWRRTRGLRRERALIAQRAATAEQPPAD
jgi:hypothetical protein